MHLRGVQTLNARGTRINDAAMTHLSDSIHTLDVSNTSISDTGLLHIAGSIRSLTIKWCNIVGSSFQHLVGLRQLYDPSYKVLARHLKLLKQGGYRIINRMI